MGFPPQSVQNNLQRKELVIYLAIIVLSFTFGAIYLASIFFMGLKLPLIIISLICLSLGSGALIYVEKKVRKQERDRSEDRNRVAAPGIF